MNAFRSRIVALGVLSVSGEWNPEIYVFENTFPLADGGMSLLLVIGAIGLLAPCEPGASPASVRKTFLRHYTSVPSQKFANIFRAGHPVWRRCSSLK